MKGNVKEIADQIAGEYSGTICCLVTMRTTDKEGQPMEYEQVYNKEFLPGYAMKQIRLRKIDENFVDSAKATEKKKRSKLQKFVLSVTDAQYGVKDQFTLGELTPYDPSKNITAGNSPIADEDSSY
jgi:predicted SPOUT superfamily RNA methylase MTH1